MSKERAELLALAQAVGLVLGKDFKNNISNTNLQKLIDEKKQSIANAIQAKEDKTPVIKGDESDTEQKAPTQEAKEETKEQENAETYDDEMQIKRISPCGNYKAIIKGIKEAARRTPGVAEDQVKESLENGEPINGWAFTEV